MGIFTKKTLGQKVAREFKLWTTPAFTERKIFKVLGKTAYKVGRFASRRLLLTSALIWAGGRSYRKMKKVKARTWGGASDPTAGRTIMSKGKWLF